MHATCEDRRQPVRVSVLATDLDGTLIPLPEHPQNQADLKTLSQELERLGTELIYITGRHYALAMQAIAQFGLPQPDWLICDVGTSIFVRNQLNRFVEVAAYQTYQAQIIAALAIETLRERLAHLPGLRLQEPEKQGRFKLSYYVDAARLNGLADEVQALLDQGQAPYSMIKSVDPFNGDGLIDLLPASISKDHALAWWVDHAGRDREAIVFAGDSGNDLAALTAGYRAIVVGNADRSIASTAYQSHRKSHWQHRLYLAKTPATSGVLEGCRWFGLAEPLLPTDERLGATPLTHDSTRFCVWAPYQQQLTVEVSHDEITTQHNLSSAPDGYFVGTVSGAGPGARYQYVLDDQQRYPDPASSFQPEGVHGASQVIDHGSFPWTDQKWEGVTKRDLIIYELHLGAFTPEGTFRAAIDRLPELLKLGVTAVEIMPVAQAPGRWNWGYDGVGLFAVNHAYGQPDDFKAFVDACHRSGLAVILDVVYNHLGPEGNYLSKFGPYFSDEHHTPWGEALAVDGAESQPVRRFVRENAIHWLDRYHLDGLRLDAVHFIPAGPSPTMLDEIRRGIADFAETTRRAVHVMAETNVYDEELLSGNESRPAYDAIWCDCLMHAIYSHALPNLRLTPREYHGAADVADALRYGYVFHGRQPSRVATEQREALPPRQRGQKLGDMVIALQTHDSVGNHARGLRLHQLTSKSYQKAAAGLTLLFPAIPLIFMGEEYAANSPFPFFADFEDLRLREAVDVGRAREYPQKVWGAVPSPSAPATFESAKLAGPTSEDDEMFVWYRQLIALRKQGLAEGWLTGSSMTSDHDPGGSAFILRFNSSHGIQVQVQTRLQPQFDSDADVTPLRVALEGHLLLSSEPATPTADGYIELGPNHTIVSRSESS